MKKKSKGSQDACGKGARYKVTKGGRTISSHKKKAAAVAARERAGKGARVGKC